MTPPAANARALRILPLIFLVCGGLGWLLVSLLFRGSPGQDWMVFDTAAHVFAAHDISLLLDGPRFTDELNRTHATWLAAPLQFHPWVYPPITMLLALPFGALPYGASYACFMALSFAALGGALWLWRDTRHRRVILIAGTLLSPATAYALGAGQNSLLLAAAMLAGVAALPARPILAGLLLALLAFKPQFGLLVPVLCLAGKHYLALAACVLGVAALCVLSLPILGLDLWRAWFHLFLSGDPALKVWIEQGRHYGQSVYTCIRIAGAGNTAANIGQAAALIFAAICVWIAFATPRPPATRITILLCAQMLAAFHVSPYDAIFLAIASMLVLTDGLSRPFRPYEASLAALLWLTALINPPALIPPGVVTPLIIAAFMFSTLRQAGHPVRAPRHPPELLSD